MTTKEQLAEKYADNVTGLDYIGSAEVELAFKAGWDAAKQELLKEFRDHFCDAYCLYFENDAYCRCCPIKNENCWLNGDDNNGTTNRSEIPNSSNEVEV